MTIHWLISLAYFSILCWSADAAQAQVKSMEPFYSHVTCKGRHDLLEDRSVALIGSAASVEFEVKTDSVILYMQSEFTHGNSFVITINDLYQGRFLLSDDQVQDIRIGLPIGQTSKIGIFKATEAATGNLLVRAIESKVPLSKVPKRSKTIEFIGNSITCGAAADTRTIPCGTGYYHDQHNAYLAYGQPEEGVLVREAQRRVWQKVRNTGMVVISDISDLEDIHPKEKLEVGNRLARMVLKKHYEALDELVESPMLSGIEIQKNKVYVEFDHCEGLYFEPNPESLFELAGADGIFFPARARIRDERVLLVSSEVKAPVYARFAWGNTSLSNLFNAAGLPASSFSTLRP